MGTLQQQSILKGQQIGKNKEKDLVHELFSFAAKIHESQTAIYYEGKIFCFLIKKKQKFMSKSNPRDHDSYKVYNNVFSILIVLF